MGLEFIAKSSYVTPVAPSVIYAVVAQLV